MQCDDTRDPLNVRLERRGLTTRPGAPMYEREVLDADGRVVFRGRALEVSRWVSAGCEPQAVRERRRVETDPPGLFSVDVMDDGADVAREGE